MLINCTNHPSKLWGKAQKKAAEAFGGAVDLPFPQIDPSDSTEELRSLAAEYAEKIEAMDGDAVLVAGEFAFVFLLVDKLLSDGVRVLCASSKRLTTEEQQPDGSMEKHSVFVFERFRDYEYFDRK
ncbi:MAG: CRISPR-associated protein [Selenomonadaceae bacterium]|nr:CRISPR-associated protein [Selenomonadaceae bacterium]MBR0283886.1 CRISPR-associated protein [Selenomonadaceae bacterium]MBR6343048.1 CRISPR-associated protein [Selenomonadaceae bacterium]MBR6905676.1 CRISPR-associated protein [Selenomonadaceae bacterium]